MGKHYNVSIDVEMPDGISEEEVGKRIEAALGAQKSSTQILAKSP
jgi:hypothetical protein